MDMDMKLSSLPLVSVNSPNSFNDNIGAIKTYSNDLSAISLCEVKTLVDIASNMQRVHCDEIAETLLAELESLLCVQGCVLGVYNKDSAESEYVISTLAERPPTNLVELFSPHASIWPFYFEDSTSQLCAYLHIPCDTVAPGRRQQMILEIALPYLYAGISRLHSFFKRIVVLNLTSREQEVMRWIIAGKDNWSICKILGVSERTVKFHNCNIYRKLGVNTRAQATSLYSRLVSDTPYKQSPADWKNNV